MPKRYTLTDAMNITDPMSLIRVVTDQQGHETYDVSEMKKAIGAMRDVMTKRVKNFSNLAPELQDIADAYTDYKSGYYPIPRLKGTKSVVDRDTAMRMLNTYEKTRYWLSLDTSTVTGVQQRAIRTYSVTQGIEVPDYLWGRNNLIADPAEIKRRYKSGYLTKAQYNEYQKLRDELLKGYKAQDKAMQAAAWDAIHKKTKRRGEFGDEFYTLVGEAFRLTEAKGRGPTEQEIELALQVKLTEQKALELSEKLKNFGDLPGSLSLFKK